MSGKVIVDKVSSRRGVNRACMVILITVIFVAPVFIIVTPTSVSASATWYATDLGIDGYAYTVPTGINIYGQVSAWSTLNMASISEALVYDPSVGSWTTLPTLGDFADALAISDSKEVVGRSRPVPSDVIHGVYWPSISSSAPIIELLPLAGATGSMAYGLNDAHQAVGASGRPGAGGLAAVVWDLDPLAPDIPAQEIGSVPDMDVTVGLDINNTGAIVGYAELESAASHRQAFYCEGVGYSIQTLLPLSGGIDGSDSVARAISDAGLIVGFSRDTNDIVHAVVWTSSSANPIDLGLANPSYANDINHDGTIVGYAAQPDGNSGFVYHSYPYGPLEFLERPPGTATWNNPVAINDYDHIASDVQMSDGEYHTFLWTPNAPPVARLSVGAIGELTVELDASASSDLEGTITSYGWNFGDGTTGSGMTVSHTYATSGVYTITLVVTDELGLTGSDMTDFGVGPRVGTMTDLADGFDCTEGQALLINNDNQVAGYFDMSGGGGIFYWDSSRGMVDIGHLVPAFSYVSDMNGNGQIVGFQEGRHVGRHGLLWDNTMLTPLELIPGETHVAPYAINDAGQVVGCHLFYQAFLWDQVHGLDDLSDIMPSGVTTSSATDINSAGHVVGLYEGTDGFTHAFFWDGSSSTVTEIMGGIPLNYIYSEYMGVYINELDQVVIQIWSDEWTGYGSDVYFWSSSTGAVMIGDSMVVQSVNDVGEVVGGVVSSEGYNRAFRWSLSSGLTYLGTAAYGNSIAYDINIAGYAVGFETVDNDGDGWYQEQACVWKPDGTRVDLGDLAGGFGNSYAYSINEENKVVGDSEAYFAGYYEIRPFLWTPDPPAPPTADFTFEYASAAGVLKVMFDASFSTDTDGTVVGYSWTFGDGTTGSGVVVYHTYAAPGTYAVTLTVTDDEGLTGQMSQSVTVDWLTAPVAEITDLEDMINAISASPAVKQDLLNSAQDALKALESRKSRANSSASNSLMSLITKIEGYTIVGEIDPGDGWNLTCEVDLIMALLANQVMIQGVPCYLWYNGCVPTSIGMIVGYYDSMRYGDLIDGDVSVQNDLANSMIASGGSPTGERGHIEDYALFPDGWQVQEDIPGELTKDASDPSLGITPHSDDCIADFTHTSFSIDVMAYGQSPKSALCTGFTRYVEYVSPDKTGTQTAKYAGTAKEDTGRSLSFSYLQKMIKAKRPVAIVVDMNGDNKSDHLVTVIGYCTLGKAKLYAFYSTWDNTIWWANFELMKDTRFFGIYNMYEFNIVAN